MNAILSIVLLANHTEMLFCTYTSSDKAIFIDLSQQWSSLNETSVDIGVRMVGIKVRTLLIVSRQGNHTNNTALFKLHYVEYETI